MDYLHFMQIHIFILTVIIHIIILSYKHSINVLKFNMDFF